MEAETAQGRAVSAVNLSLQDLNAIVFHVLVSEEEFQRQRELQVLIVSHSQGLFRALVYMFPFRPRLLSHPLTDRSTAITVYTYAHIPLKLKCP